MSKRTNISDFSQICNTAILRSGATNTKSVNEMLVKLLITLIEYKKFDYFKKEDLIESFKSFYNLSISKMMLGEAIPYLKKGKYIKEEEKNNYRVNKTEIAKLNYLKPFQDFVRQKEVLLEEFIHFAQENTLEIKKEDAERILAYFVEDSICSLGNASPSENNVEDKEKYVASLFISREKEKASCFYEIFENILVGRMLASFILSGNKIANESITIFNKMTIFLDSGFIFNLLGLNNYSTSNEYVDLLSNLSSLGAKFKIFDHIFNEVFDIIESSIQWVDNVDYQGSRASDVNEYFVSNGFTKEEIEEYLYSLETKLKEYGIEKYETNIDYNEPDIIYQENIKKLIVDEYIKSGFFQEGKDNTYELDAKSLFAIHKLRKGKIYRRFEDTEFFLLTTNRGIARVSNAINKETFGGKTISFAFTDTFISVLLFFTYPNYSSDTNERFCIPFAYHAFEPSKELVKKIEKVLSDIQNKGLITQADSFSWRTSKVLSSYIVEETKNDANNFNDDTPDKIFELIQQEADRRVESAKKEADEYAEEVFKEAESKIREYSDDKSRALQYLEHEQKINRELRDELNRKDIKEKENLILELGNIAKKNDKKTKIFYRIILTTVIVVGLIVIGFLLWLSDFLKNQNNIFLQILCYLISAAVLFLSFLPFPFLLGEKLKKRIKECVEKRSRPTTDSYNDRIKTIDEQVNKRTLQ